jgi:hypothetical protein
MSIGQAYLGISSFFDIWVRVMELRTRRMEVKDSADGGSRRLIKPPPSGCEMRRAADLCRTSAKSPSPLQPPSVSSRCGRVASIDLLGTPTSHRLFPLRMSSDGFQNAASV